MARPRLSTNYPGAAVRTFPLTVNRSPLCIEWIIRRKLRIAAPGRLRWDFLASGSIGGAGGAARGCGSKLSYKQVKDYKSVFVRGGMKKGRPRLTVQRHREEPEVDKLIEAHPIRYRMGCHYHPDF